MIDFPERLRLRNTGLCDDLGGLGQGIFTTAGQGYEKCEYVRSDLHEDALEEIERLREIVLSHQNDFIENELLRRQLAEIREAQGEPVGKVIDEDSYGLVVHYLNGLPPAGSLLFTAPPPPSYPWQNSPPERDGDFFYAGPAPNYKEDVVAIVSIVTNPDTKERWAYLFIPPYWRGQKRTTAVVHFDAPENWPGQWAGPEYGLNAVVLNAANQERG